MTSYELNPFTGKFDAVHKSFTFFDIINVWRLGTVRNFLQDEEDFSLIDCGSLSNIQNCKTFRVGNLEDL